MEMTTNRTQWDAYWFQKIGRNWVNLRAKTKEVKMNRFFLRVVREYEFDSGSRLTPAVRVWRMYLLCRFNYNFEIKNIFEESWFIIVTIKCFLHHSYTLLFSNKSCIIWLLSVLAKYTLDILCQPLTIINPLVHPYGSNSPTGNEAVCLGDHLSEMESRIISRPCHLQTGYGALGANVQMRVAPKFGRI